MEKLFTDNEIIKALECLSNDETVCNGCKYEKFKFPKCQRKVAKNALDLIKRQNAENERLKEVVERLQKHNRELCMLEKMQIDRIESEARKEFAEIILNHLQQRIDECDNMTSEDPIWVNRLKWARESIVIFIHKCLYKLEKEREKET